MKKILKELPTIGFAVLLTIVLVLCAKMCFPAPEPQQCVSPRTLEGCEKAGAVVEEQLRRCEHAFTYCIETNIKLKERLEKGD